MGDPGVTFRAGAVSYVRTFEFAMGPTVSARCRVVIIGAGYAGVMAANRLAGAYGLRDSADVNRLRAAFRAGSAATVIVIGAGLTGIEVFCRNCRKISAATRPPDFPRSHWGKSLRARKPSPPKKKSRLGAIREDEYKFGVHNVRQN